MKTCSCFTLPLLMTSQAPVPAVSRTCDRSAVPVGQLPQRRSDLSAIDVNGHAFVLGGFDWARDPATYLEPVDGASFRVVAQLPHPVLYAGVAALGNVRYLLGGQVGSHQTAEVQAVDVSSGATRSTSTTSRFRPPRSPPSPKLWTRTASPRTFEWTGDAYREIPATIAVNAEAGQFPVVYLPFPELFDDVVGADTYCGDGDWVEAATRRGILVINTPESSTIAAAEHTFAMMLALARQKATAQGLAVRFEQGDAENLPFAAASFDLAISRHVLWTLPHPEAAIDEWIRLLRPGWRLAVADNGEGIGQRRGDPVQTGLGTSIVEALAHQLNAKVHKSAGPTGTTVSITASPASGESQ